MDQNSQQNNALMPLLQLTTTELDTIIGGSGQQSNPGQFPWQGSLLAGRNSN